MKRGSSLSSPTACGGTDNPPIPGSASAVDVIAAIVKVNEVRKSRWEEIESKEENLKVKDRSPDL